MASNLMSRDLSITSMTLFKNYFLNGILPKILRMYS